MDQQLVCMPYEFNPSEIKIDLNVDYCLLKPSLAPWSSTAIKLEDGSYTSRFLLWAWDNIEQYRDMNRYLITPKKDLKVYELTDLKSTFDLVYDIAKGPFPIYSIDFIELYNKGYDGLTLSKQVAGLMHYFRIDNWLHNIYSKLSSNELSELYKVADIFNSWDTESTVWLRPDWYESYELVFKGVDEHEEE